MLLRENAIRDPDLLAKLEESRGTPGYELCATSLTARQARRDRDQAKETKRVDELSALPRDARRRAVVRDSLESGTPKPKNLSYIATPLAICALPYRPLPAGQTEYIRQQGRMRVAVSAGEVVDPDCRHIAQSVPWGPKARLIIVHLCTEAVRNRSPVVEIAGSVISFIREIGFEPRGNIRPFQLQLQAVTACPMAIDFWDDRSTTTLSTNLCPGTNLWFSEKPDRQSWPTTITFAEEFYRKLIRHFLPVNTQALRALSNSARKLDLLFWITYRTTRLEKQLVIGRGSVRQGI